MARPTCVKCGGFSFGLQDFDPPGKMYKIELLLCSHCGAVVGTTGYLEGISRIDYLYRAMQHVLKKLGIFGKI